MSLYLRLNTFCWRRCVIALLRGCVILVTAVRRCACCTLTSKDERALLSAFVAILALWATALLLPLVYGSQASADRSLSADQQSAPS
jgi:hypothetical protein